MVRALLCRSLLKYHLLREAFPNAPCKVTTTVTPSSPPTQAPAIPHHLHCFIFLCHHTVFIICLPLLDCQLHEGSDMCVLSSAGFQSQEQCLAHSWCMSYLLLHDKLYLKYSALKQHLVGCSLSGSSGSAYVKVLAAAAASSEYPNGEDVLQAHAVVGRIQCLTGDWTEGLSASLLARI